MVNIDPSGFAGIIFALARNRLIIILTVFNIAFSNVKLFGSSGNSVGNAFKLTSGTDRVRRRKILRQLNILPDICVTILQKFSHFNPAFKIFKNKHLTFTTLSR